MFDTLRNAWHIADIRKKILYTLMIIAIFRIGSAIPVPFVDPNVLKQLIEGSAGLGYLDILTGGGFSNATIFAMSITPYITASIVIQLLTIAIPALERLAKEGEEGKKVIDKITRYTSMGLALIQSIAYFLLLRNQGALRFDTGFSFWFSAIVIVSMFTAGSALIIWLGERIDVKGIGNGISMILFAGIISRAPHAAMTLWGFIELANKGEPRYYFLVPLVLVLFLFIIAFIVLMTNAERRIPVQYAKRVVGRKMYGGQSTHIPIKVNMSGVLPIIFASSLLSIPGTIKGFVFPTPVDTTLYHILSWFDYNRGAYAILYFLLIIAFNYFYVAVQYNPIEMANNLQKNNGGIPGIRPGRPTSEFISKVISKITLIGALFLAVIAILPIGLNALTKMNIALGGTSILILVGVALDTMRALESQMMMRHYKGFLE